jgi:hypothetical protein
MITAAANSHEAERPTLLIGGREFPIVKNTNTEFFFYVQFNFRWYLLNSIVLNFLLGNHV